MPPCVLCIEKLLNDNVANMTDKQLLRILHEMEQLESEIGSAGPTPFSIVRKEIERRRQEKGQS